MEPRSPYHQLRQLGFAAQGWRPADDADRKAQKAYDALQRRLQLAESAMRDYELSSYEEDTRTQMRLLPRAVKGLEGVREALLTASEYDLVGAVDVAQTSAQLDELIDRLH